MSLEKRVSALEAAAGAGDASHGKPWHSVTVRDGQSLADAVRAHGMERIGEHDNLIVRGIVSPKFDEQGIMIPVRPGTSPGGPCRLPSLGRMRRTGVPRSGSR